MIPFQADGASALNDIILSYMRGDFIDSRTAGFIDLSVQIGTLMAAGYGSIVLAFNYLKNSFNSFTDGQEGKLIDPVLAGKIILICMLINAYGSLIGPTLNYFYSIAETYKMSSNEYDTASKNINELHDKTKIDTEQISQNSYEYWENCTDCDPDQKKIALQLFKEHQESGGETKPEGGSSTILGDAFDSMNEAIKSIQTLLMNPNILVTSIFHALANMLVYLIRLIVKMVSFYLLKILVIIGPFAIAISIIPGFNGQLMKWFGTLVNIMMAFLIFNVLDALFADHLSNISGLFTGMIADASVNSNPINIGGATMNANPYSMYQSIMIIGFDLSVIALYISVFWLASKVAGTGDAGSIIGKTMQIGSVAFGAAATAAIAGGNMAVTAGAGGGGVPVSGGSGGGGASSAVSAVSPTKDGEGS